MRVGIQGLPGSACDEAAVLLIEEEEASFVYLTDAEGVLSALFEGSIDVGVLAAESPLGIPVPETAVALPRYPAVDEIAELRSEVRHCILVRPGEENAPITTVASHAIPLAKHRDFLANTFRGYTSLELPDTGLAAKKLAAGELPANTAVIAMKRAAELFGLAILHSSLPKNDDYQSKFLLVKKPTSSALVE